MSPLPDPHRYFEAAGDQRDAVVDRPPVCLYLEVTNRCNLLCETCPRTFEELEPPADMSWDLFTRIVDQVPDLARAVLHGVGEPMLVRELPRMIQHLSERGVYVLFNTNGTLLDERRGRELVASGLHELRVSLDAAEAGAYARVRGVDALRAGRRERPGVHGPPARARRGAAARVALAHGAEGDGRAALPVRAARPRARRR